MVKSDLCWMNALEKRDCEFDQGGYFVIKGAEKLVLQDHMGSLMPKMQSTLPQNVENEWTKMLLNCSWKPLELGAAIRISRKQSKSEAHDFFEESYHRNGIDDSKECFVDTYLNEYEWDLSDNKEFDDVEWTDCDEDQSNKETLLCENWHLSDDPERGKLLEKIQAIFESLIRNECLVSNHLSKVIHFAVEELQSLACGSLR